MDSQNLTATQFAEQKQTVINMLDEIIKIAYNNKIHLSDISNRIESLPMCDEMVSNPTDDYDVLSRLRRIILVLQDCNAITRSIKEKI